jgi:hypothetical protein
MSLDNFQNQNYRIFLETNTVNVTVGLSNLWYSVIRKHKIFCITCVCFFLEGGGGAIHVFSSSFAWILCSLPYLKLNISKLSVFCT